MLFPGAIAYFCTIKHKCMRIYNNIGRRYERSGIYSQAIIYYESCLFSGCLSLYNYKRLAVIYRQRNDMDNFRRVVGRLNALRPVLL